MTVSKTAQELVGKTIKDVFKRAEEVAELHSALSSPRGDYFRLHLLQRLDDHFDESMMERGRVEAGVQEYQRHLNKLLRVGLVVEQELNGQKTYTRSRLGETAVNAMRELQRNIGGEEARAIYAASLGPNSVRFFLRIYGDKQDGSWDRSEVQYTPAEIGRLSLFLPRVIEGVSAIDKLSEAGLVVYRDDGYVYIPPVKARGFYRYLLELYEIVRANGRRNSSRRHQD